MEIIIKFYGTKRTPKKLDLLSWKLCKKASIELASIGYATNYPTALLPIWHPAPTHRLQKLNHQSP